MRASDANRRANEQHESDMESARLKRNAGSEAARLGRLGTYESLEMTQDQRRRMGGFQKAMMGLHARDTRLLRSGWKEMVPNGAEIDIPRFSFNGDGSVDVEFSSGEIARGTTQQIYRNMLAPSAPTAEVPAKGRKGKGGDFYDQEEYKALLKERGDLQKTVSSGVNKYGFEVKPEKMAAMKSRLSEIDGQLNSLSGKTNDGGLRYGAKDYGGGEPTAGKPLDVDTARAILKEAGGDKDKARQIAKSRGYSIGGDD